jgi:outer membrane receptor for ferrienterochelin and colicin
MAGFLLISVVLSFQSVLATDGVITGRVIDRETGEPLCGVTIGVLGSTLGAITNKHGDYTMSKIPAGHVTLTVRMIGYATVTERDIAVTSGEMTRLDVQLEMAPINMDKEVIVNAERPIFRSDITASVHFAGGRDMERMPVESFQDVVEIQPGVVAGHFRGGRKGEVLYLIDDMPIQDPTTGGPGSTLSKSSVSAMTVRTGGFEAEFGKAMSGVVNIVTRSGGKRLEGSFWSSFDRPGGFAPSYDVTSFEDEQQYEGSFGGSLGQRVRLFFSGNYNRSNGRFRKKMLGVFPSPIDQRANLSGKTTVELTKNLRTSLSGLFSNSDWHEYEHRWKNHVQGLPNQKKQSYRIGSATTYVLSEHTLCRFYLSQYNLFSQVFGRNARLYNPTVELDDEGYVVTGDKAWWQDNQQLISSVAGSITSQISERHRVKTGGEFVYYDLNMNNVQYRGMETVDPDFPMYIAYHTEYAYYPKSSALYIQDKFQYKGMTVDAGLRFDRFDPCATRPAIERDPYTRTDDWVVELEDRVKSSPKGQFSPRIGFAFPIGGFDVARFNYGYFFQMPLFEHLYTNIDYNLATGYPPLVGDPDLKAAKTIAYETSIKHFFSQSTVIVATLFSKDISDLIDLRTHLIPEEEVERGLAPGYSKYVNMSSAYVRGFEIDLQKVCGRFLTGRLSYTFQTARGTGSTVSLDAENEPSHWGAKVPIGAYYLSWDQRHTFVMNADFYDEDNWGTNLLCTWNSPLPYTERDGEPNEARMWNRYSLDVRVEKIFNPGGKSISVYGEIKNLLDTKNVMWVDWDGRPGGELDDPTAWCAGRRIWVGANLRL